MREDEHSIIMDIITDSSSRHTSDLGLFKNFRIPGDVKSADVTLIYQM